MDPDRVTDDQGDTLDLTEDMTERMLEVGIHVGEEVTRRELALRVLADGMTLEQFQAIHTHFMRLCQGDAYRAASIMVQRLQEPKRWRALLRELGRFLAGQRPRSGEVNRPRKEWQPGTTFEDYLLSRHLNDGVPKELLAEQHGLTVEELEAKMEGRLE